MKEKAVGLLKLLEKANHLIPNNSYFDIYSVKTSAEQWMDTCLFQLKPHCFLGCTNQCMYVHQQLLPK